MSQVRQGKNGGWQGGASCHPRLSFFGIITLTQGTESLILALRWFLPGFYCFLLNSVGNGFREKLA
jgi:hypothetical protein